MKPVFSSLLFCSASLFSLHAAVAGGPDVLPIEAVTVLAIQGPVTEEVEVDVSIARPKPRPEEAASETPEPAAPPISRLRPKPRPPHLASPEPAAAGDDDMSWMPTGITFSPSYLLTDPGAGARINRAIWLDGPSAIGSADFVLDMDGLAAEALASAREVQEKLFAEDPALATRLKRKGTPEGRFTDEIAQDLSTRYDLETTTEQDLARFFDLADGVAVQEYKMRDAKIAALKVTNATFEKPEAPAPQDQVSRLRTFMETPDGKRALARMTPEQIVAITEMMSLLEAPRSTPAPATPALAPAEPVVTAQADLPGVPSLTFKPDAGSASAGANVRNVGSGQNLLLAGWTVKRNADGTVSMFQSGDPTSGIEVSKGMVMGALGAVTSIEDGEGGVVVRFQTGDEIREDYAADEPLHNPPAAAPAG